MDALNITGSDPSVGFAALKSSLDRRISSDIKTDTGAIPSNLETQRVDLASARSSLSVDSMTYRRSERTTLYIRTREGDVVRLKFRSREALKLESSRTSDGESVRTELELSAKSKSTLSVQVRGNLNAEELAAIQSAIEQAGVIAEEFFAGDLAAAFDSVAALDIDGSQLARVTLNVRAREHLTYSSYRATTSTPESYTPLTDIPVMRTPLVETVAPQQPGEILMESASGTEVVSGGVTTIEQAEEPQDERVPAEPLAVGAPAMPGLSFVRDFLTRLTDVLGQSHDEGVPGQSYAKISASIDVSLKLRIFQSTLLVFAEARPDEPAPLPELVPETIDELVAQLQGPLDQVA